MLNKSVKKYFFLFTLLVAFLSACDINPSNVQVAMRDTKLNIIPITQVSGSAQTLTQVGLPFQFIAVEEVAGEYKDVTQKVTWHSSNPEVASVGQGQVRGMKKGETLIYALLPITSASGLNADSVSASSSGSFTHRSSNKVSLLIKDEPLLVLQISPNEKDHPMGTLTHKLPVGAKQSLNAIATFADNTSFDVTSFVDWYSDKKDIVKMQNFSQKGFAQTLRASDNASNTKGIAQMQGIGESGIYATFFENQSNTLPFVVSSATLISLDISPDNPSIAALSHQEFIATAIYSDGTHQDVTQHVTWQSDNLSVATMSGEEAHGLGAGQAKISASWNQKSSDFVSLTVTDAKLVALQITPSEPMLNVGEDLFYKVKAIFNDGSTDDISEHVLWQSSEPDVAQVIGSYTKAASVGQAQIQARYQGITSNTSTLTVSDHQLIRLQLTPTVSELAKSTQTELTVMGEYDDGETIDITDKVTWHSEDPNIAFITHGHVYGTAVGKTRIYTVFDGVRSNEARIRVIRPNIRALQISPAIKTIPIKGTVDYQAQATFVDGNITTRQDVSHLVAWKNEHTDIANLSHQNATGLSKGAATISAKLNEAIPQVQLTVTDSNVVKLQLTPTAIALAKGTSQSLQVIARYFSGGTGDVTDNVSWHLSDNTLASIDNETHEITAIKEGAGTITARWNSNQISSNAATLSVNAAQLVSIYVIPSWNEVIHRNSTRFEAFGLYSDGSYQDITSLVSWSNSDTSKATVLKGDVLALAAGTTQISANFNGVHANVAELHIIADVLTEIVISPADGQILLGASEQFSAVGHYQSGQQIDITTDNGVIWRADSSNLQIDNHGLATAIFAQDDKITITASKSAIEGSTLSKIIEPDVDSLKVSLRNSDHPQEITRGTKLAIIATATMSDNTTKDVSSSVDWYESSDSEHTTISSSGWVTAIWPGTSTITATYNGKTSNEVQITTLSLGDHTCAVSQARIIYNSKKLIFHCPVTLNEYSTQTYLTGNGALAPGGMTIPLVNWNEAKKYCEDNSLRLPTRAELHALVSTLHAPKAGGANLYVDYGWHVQRNYWSSSSENGGRYWTVNMRTRYNWLTGADDGNDHSFSCVEEE